MKGQGRARLSPPPRTSGMGSCRCPECPQGSDAPGENKMQAGPECNENACLQAESSLRLEGWDVLGTDYLPLPMGQEEGRN